MNEATEEALRDRLVALCRNDTTNVADAVRHVPAARYTDAVNHRAEINLLFRDYPIAALASGEIRSPGDFVSQDIAGLAVLFVRDDDGRARAYLNVCGHRANTLCQEGEGNRKRFVCSYHGWTYDLAGTRRAARNPSAFEGVDEGMFALQELSCEERHGLVWIVPSGRAGSREVDVRGYLGHDFDDELTAHRLENYVTFRSTTFEQRFNWKLGIDTFQEVYHVPVLHKVSLRDLFTAYADNESFNDRHARLTVVRQSFVDQYLANGAGGSILPHVSIDYHLFPNTVLIWQMDHIELWHFYPDPVDVNVCHVRNTLLVPEPPDERATRYWNRNWEVMQQSVWYEDFATMQQVQKNLVTGQVSGLWFGRNEFGLHHYHDVLDRELGSSNAIDGE